MTTIQKAIAEAIPNLDSFTTPNDALAQNAEFKEVIPALKDLASYCEAKNSAMLSRMAGKIEQAVRFESACDTLYNRLPDWAKTW